MTSTISAHHRDFVTEFHNNPVGFRVFLPDGTLAVVKKFQDTEQGRSVKVQGIHRNGRYRKLMTPSAWFDPDDLEILIYSASINPDWPRL
jgi:hypothetical protein